MFDPSKPNLSRSQVKILVLLILLALVIPNTSFAGGLDDQRSAFPGDSEVESFSFQPGHWLERLLNAVGLHVYPASLLDLSRNVRDENGKVTQSIYIPLVVSNVGNQISPTPTPTNTVILPTEPVPGPTLIVTSTPPKSGPTPTPQGTPSPGDNLLVNGSLFDGFTGWSMDKGYWQVHIPIACEPSGTNYAEMDRDVGTNTWPVGGEDRLWQDVFVPIPHMKVILSLTEAHHMITGIAEVKLYGSQNGKDWTVIYQRPEVESPFGTGKCIKDMPPKMFTYEIQASYPYYQLEIRGRMVHENDGWLIGNLVLKVN
jgi:hypothetical protein